MTYDSTFFKYRFAIGVPCTPRCSTITATAIFGFSTSDEPCMVPGRFRPATFCAMTWAVPDSRATVAIGVCAAWPVPSGSAYHAAVPTAPRHISLKSGENVLSVSRSVFQNGGHFYRPTLLKQTRNRETGAVKTFSPEIKSLTTINAAALDLVRQALAGVVAEPGGTGHAAQTPIATVAGKSGTAQVIAQKVAGRKLAEAARDHAWFIAYAPVENPKIAVAVIVEHGVHGGSAAAPIAKRVIEEYLKNVESKIVH